MSTTLKSLLYTKTLAYRHASIPALTAHLTTLPSLTLTHTEDSQTLIRLLPDSDVLILGHTTGAFLCDADITAIAAFLQKGGGLVAIHAATSAMEDSDWYLNLLGARFDGHPEPQWGLVTVDDTEHFITKGLPLPKLTHAPASAPPCPSDMPYTSSSSATTFPWYDEFYNFRLRLGRLPEKAHLLISVDESSYKGGKHGAEHPLAWCHEHGDSRVFYTSLGHFDAAYEDEWFAEILVRALHWVSAR